MYGYSRLLALLSFSQVATAPIEETDDEDTFLSTHSSVESLVNFGVQTSDIKKLKESGVTTAEGVLRMTKRKLEGIKGISTAKVEKLRDAASHVAKRPSFQVQKRGRLTRSAAGSL